MIAKFVIMSILKVVTILSVSHLTIDDQKRKTWIVEPSSYNFSYVGDKKKKLLTIGWQLV